ncbi:putative N-acetylated-alpha-linked acidic dipeptidase [Asterias rubens]|uniref:putative N-acetylated-alpha-linked acidic dipeptidase n=1 Tax=Asterias rubens TaxID=7604 RepID=UPI001455D7D8|nr:putative N-acetylated-alpha-linked acidic dipeptidase [Asterias rubens]
MASGKVVFAVSVVLLVVGLVVGILLGHYVTAPAAGGNKPPSGSSEPTVPKSYQDAVRKPDSSISGRLINGINPDKIRDNLEYLSAKSHVAGSAVSLEQAKWIRDSWLEQGLDKAELTNYNVLLSYPPEKNDSQQNRIELLTSSGGAVEFTTQLREPPLDPDTDTPVGDPDILAPFNAYSGSGEIEGDLVYVNYGRVEDFHKLERELNISVIGKICIARYGKIFRGTKAAFAEKSGCLGLILYSDPLDYTVAGEPVYPDGIYLPGTGTQRGTLMSGTGDPLTPGYPAIDSAYRTPINETNLPNIPVHPIGYNDAAHFLGIMGGEETSADWAGSISNVTYRYGPGFNATNQDKKVAMRIFTENRMANAYNTIGTIRGSVEPDRYVIIGNHRDAWGYGAVDPSSGTACMMEISRIFGSFVKDGWRPRRTIMFASWGAEEYGLIGSNEWVEEYIQKLGGRAVAYLNVDTAVIGTYILGAFGTPNLHKTIYQAAQKIPDPNPEGTRMTVYDTWKERDFFGNTIDGNPTVGDLGSGSDYASFLQLAGISAIDLRYTFDRISTPIPAFYPLYHSVYETFTLVDRYLDPGFKYHKAMSQLMGEIARNLAESILLPMDVGVYAEYVKGYYESLRQGNIGQRLTQEGISLADMQDAVNELSEAANAFVRRVDAADRTDVLQVRMLNDQMHRFERAFVDPQGLPGRPFVRHIVFAPSSRDAYSNDKFPGIVDTMFDIDKNPDPEKWNHVKKQLSVAIFTIKSAASVLLEVA